MFKKILVTLAVAAVIGCAGPDIRSKAEIATEAKSAMDVARESAYKKSEYDNVHFVDTFYVPELNEADKLKPNWFFQEEIVGSSTLVLSEVMGSVFNKRGIAVRYVDGVDPLRVVSINHMGTVGGLLDKVSSALGYYYSFDNNTITWSQFQTEVLDVAFFSGQAGFFFGSDGSQSLTTQNTNQNVVETSAGAFGTSKEFVNFKGADIDVWKELGAAIKIQLSEKGVFELSESSASLVIKDYPENVDRVKRYISKLNDTLTQLIQVDIEILEFTSNNGRTFDIDWDLAKVNLAAGGVFNFTSAFQPESSTVQPTILSYTQQSGKYAGSSALISALSQQGTVHRVSKRTVLSMNNQPTYVNRGDKDGYLAAAGSTSTANVGSNDILQLGILNYGDSIKFLPRAINDTVMVRLSTNTSVKKNIRRVSDNERSIESPETSYEENLLSFVARDGDTVLATSRKISTKGATEDRNILSFIFGGRAENTNDQTEVIILMTPRIVRHYE